MRTEVLQNVPAADVDQVVADFEAQGATVTKTLQADGRFTVTAKFP